MRTLEYHPPYRPNASICNKEYAIKHPNGNFETGYSIITKHGIVIITSMKWETNFGWDEWTRFQTMINGMVYTAYLNQVEFHSTRAMRWMATHFIKTILKKIEDGLSNNAE